MLLKRILKPAPDWVKQVNKRGECINPPPLDYVALAHTGTHAEQNFSEGLVGAGIREGWISFGKGKLTLDVHPEPLVYTVKRTPGLYCCHCQARLGSQIEARLHVATEHEGIESPDPQNPSGYLGTLAFECVLDSAQHDKFKVPPRGRAVHFHLREERRRG